MSSDRIVYITEKITNHNEYYKEHNRYLYSFYDIPNDIQEAFDITWYDYVRRIEYICPFCATRIRAEWIFPSRVSLKKGYKNKYNENWLKKIEVGFDDYLVASYNEVSNACKLKNCPICNAKLFKEYPYVFINTDVSSFPSKMRSAARWLSKCNESKPNYFGQKTYDYPQDINEIEEILLADMSKKSDDYVQACDVTSAYKAIEVNVNADFLKKYLAHLLNLESNIMSMAQRLTQLYVLRAENDRAIAFDSKFPLINDVREKEKEIQYKFFLLECAKAELKVLTNSPIKPEKTKKPPCPKEPIMQKSNIFNRKRIEAQNAQALQEYEWAMEKYKETLAIIKEEDKKKKEFAEREKNIKIAEYSEKIPQYETEIETERNELKVLNKQKTTASPRLLAIRNIIDSEIVLIEESLRNSYKCRNDLYSYNIVFEKYRNLVALSTFYEYLMAGRCESLEGATGAYNIYENEIRLDTIITQLEEIKAKLEDIKQNQYMIYKTLQSISASLHSLSSSMAQATMSLKSIDVKATTTNEYLKTISNNTDIIAYNSAVSAYYSKKNAELTDALGFMVAFK